MRHLLIGVAIFGLVAGGIPHVGAASSATSVAITSAGSDGGAVRVAGTATFAAQPFVEHGTDPMGDTGQYPPVLGQDLVAASTASTPDGKIVLRFSLSQLMPVVDRAAVGVQFGRSFCVHPPNGDSPSCWEVAAGAMAPLVSASGLWAELWSCGDESCDPGNQTRVGYIPNGGTYDGPAKAVIVTVPFDMLKLRPGSILTPVDPWGGNGSVWTAVRSYYQNGDVTSIDTSYEVPIPEVSLALESPGQAPETVDYDARATLAGDGKFSGTLAASSFAPGAYAVYARACFGANNCAYATAPVTL